MSHRFAVLVDGAFFVRKLYKKIGNKLPDIDDVLVELSFVLDNEKLKNFELLRVYYYDAEPATNTIINPISGEKINLSQTDVARRNKAFLQSLELKDDISLRLGETSTRGMKISTNAAKSLRKENRILTADDFSPDIEQKGVDLRMGLDIARLSLGRLVSTIVVITGDSDLIPAFKFARREGVRVILRTMGHGVKRDLKAHTDGLLE